MPVKTIYACLCVLGAILPFTQFVPWVASHGLNGRLLLQELFASRISAFFAWDVIVSAVVVLVFAYTERERLRARVWWVVAAVFCVGVSLGLPLLLLLRKADRA